MSVARPITNRRAVPAPIELLARIAALIPPPRHPFMGDTTASSLVEDPTGRVATRVLDAICDATVGERRESLQREGRTRAVAHQALASSVVVGADRD